MARPFVWLAMAVLIAGSTGESFAGIVVVQNDSYMMVPGDTAVLFDNTHSNFPIPSTWYPDPGDTLNFAQVSAPLAYANQGFSLQPDAIVGSGAAEAYSGTTPIEVHSVLDVTFEVTAPSWFVLTGDEAAFIGDVSAPDAVSHSFTGSVMPDVVVQKTGPYDQFFAAGRLVPGVDYRIFFSSSEFRSRAAIARAGVSGWRYPSPRCRSSSHACSRSGWYPAGHAEREHHDRRDDSAPGASTGKRGGVALH